jgi:hypothetical protein
MDFFFFLISFDDEQKLCSDVIVKSSNFLCCPYFHLFLYLCIVYVTAPSVAQIIIRRMIRCFNLKRTQTKIFMIVQNAIID